MKKLIAFNKIEFTLSISLLLSACGGGGSSSVTSNTIPVVIDSGPLPITNPTRNILYTTVTVCKPGTTNCQTIDHIQVDSGSIGLRIINSAAITNLGLQVMQVNNLPVSECITFGIGYTWGSIVYADLYWGNQFVKNTPINVIAGSTAAVPALCSDFAIPPLENTVASFSANGIIGINPVLYDHESTVFRSESSGYGYYTCNGNDCNYITLPNNQQVINPISGFPVGYNNGYIIKLPAVNANYATILVGELILGLNSESNNQIPANAIIVYSNPVFGVVNTIYQDIDYKSIFDSGSNEYYFTDNTIPKCEGELYCPINPLNLNAQVHSYTPPLNITTTPFTIKGLDGIPNTAAVLPYIGSYAQDIFLWGLPFFMGKNVYIALDKSAVSGQSITPFAGYSSYTDK